MKAIKFYFTLKLRTKRYKNTLLTTRLHIVYHFVVAGEGLIFEEV
jgi:hypothetical protein